jgi:hypothetical protein
VLKRARAAFRALKGKLQPLHPANFQTLNLRQHGLKSMFSTKAKQRAANFASGVSDKELPGCYN